MSGVPEQGRRMLTWSVHETAGFDTAWVALDPTAGTLAASGRAVGQKPEPYWLTYELETDAEYVTRRLWVEARTVAKTTTLDLHRSDGRWSVNGSERPELADVLDCDLGACPLTNTMPVLRHRLHLEPGSRILRVAFVQVPSLRVLRVEQRYTHLYRLGDGSAVVRYRSAGFEDDLTIDPEGFVSVYPKLARRVVVGS